MRSRVEVAVYCSGAGFAGVWAAAEEEEDGVEVMIAQVLHQRSTLDQGAVILSPVALLFACMAAVPLLHQVQGHRVLYVRVRVHEPNNPVTRFQGDGSLAQWCGLIGVGVGDAAAGAIGSTFGREFRARSLND
jgi:hypothetical protein